MSTVLVWGTSIAELDQPRQQRANRFYRNLLENYMKKQVKKTAKPMYKVRKAKNAGISPAYQIGYTAGHTSGLNERRALAEEAYAQGFKNAAAAAAAVEHAAWLTPAEAVRPGLYLCQGHEGKGVALRLVKTDSGPGRETLHWSDETGAVVGSHCLKRVYGPVEEDGA